MFQCCFHAFFFSVYCDSAIRQRFFDADRATPLISSITVIDCFRRLTLYATSPAFSLHGRYLMPLLFLDDMMLCATLPDALSV